MGQGLATCLPTGEGSPLWSVLASSLFMAPPNERVCTQGVRVGHGMQGFGQQRCSARALQCMLE
jgi:hypothetical protein